MRRNNDELVANWGNLVNRTLQSAYKNFGHVPEPGRSPTRTRRCSRRWKADFETVGAQIEQARFRAALAEAMHLATRVNQYVSDQAPWAVLEADRERAATILHVALRCIDNLKLLFTRSCRTARSSSTSSSGTRA